MHSRKMLLRWTLSLTEANTYEIRLALDGIRSSPKLFLCNGGARSLDVSSKDRSV